MYSLVLMTAMTASAPEAPKCPCLFQGIFNRFGSGCWGGGGCSGCQGYTNGCRGGCNGCGGCYGCYGCAGGCIGAGNGGRMPAAAPMAYLSGQSVFPPFVTAGASPIYIGSEGIWAGTWSYSGIAPGAPPSFIPGSVGKAKSPEPKEEETSARIIVHIPKNAKLFIDGQIQSGDSTERHFYTPPLPRVGSFYYDVRIETVKDGKTIIDEKKVIVQAGALVHQTFNLAGTATSLASGQ